MHKEADKAKKYKKVFKGKINRKNNKLQEKNSNNELLIKDLEMRNNNTILFSL